MHSEKYLSLASFVFLLLSACAPQVLPSGGVGELRVHRAPFPPTPDWYEEHFDDSGWELLSSARLFKESEEVFVRQHFELGPAGALVTEVFLKFPERAAYTRAYLNGVALTEPKERRGKKLLRFTLPPGTLREKDNVLALSFAPQTSPTLPVVEAIFPSERSAPLHLVRGPYLLYPTGEGVTVAFEASLPCIGWVEYGDGSWTRTSPKRARYHMLRISNLAPGERFPYRVACEAEGERVESVWGTFATSPAPGSGARIAVFAGRGDIQDFARQAPLFASFSPDLALLVGEFLPPGGEAKAWDAFFRAGYSLFQNTAAVPVLSSLQRSWDGFKRTANLFALPESAVGAGRAYSFDYGSAHIIILDGDVLSATRVRSWLRDDIAGARAQGKQVILVLSRAFWGGRNFKEEILDRSLPSSDFDLVVLAGKAAYERGESPGGIPYVLLGGSFSDDGKGRAAEAALLEISPRGIWVRVYGEEGALLDEARVES